MMAFGKDCPPQPQTISTHWLPCEGATPQKPVKRKRCAGAGNCQRMGLHAPCQSINQLYALHAPCSDHTNIQSRQRRAATAQQCLGLARLGPVDWALVLWPPADHTPVTNWTCVCTNSPVSTSTADTLNSASPNLKVTWVEIQFNGAPGGCSSAIAAGRKDAGCTRMQLEVVGAHAQLPDLRQELQTDAPASASKGIYRTVHTFTSRLPLAVGRGSSSVIVPRRRMPGSLVNPSALLGVQNRSTLTTSWKGLGVPKVCSTSLSASMDWPLDTKRLKPRGHL